jgi:hypothetical protein
MHLRLSDLDDNKPKSECYLTHPFRSEDTDDVLIDVANQFELSKRDLSVWSTATSSWKFMENLEGCEVDLTDFIRELDSLSG